MSALVAAMHSARREIGTQTSVGKQRQAGLQLQAGEIGVVPGLPQAAAVFRVGRPLEIGTAQFAGDGLHGFRLFGDPGRAAVEFEEQGRRLGQRRLAEQVDGLQRQRVEQFDARHRHAELDGLDDRLHGRIDVGKVHTAAEMASGIG